MKRILVIDDREIIEQVKKILKKAGDGEYRVSGTPFERKALRILKKDLPFDLILLELKNPRVSERFYETLLKETSTPVVLISSIANPEDILTALRKGCAGYIKKPLKSDRFLYRMKEILSEREEKKEEK